MLAQYMLSLIRGSLRRGQRTFRPDDKEDQHICFGPGYMYDVKLS